MRDLHTKTRRSYSEDVPTYDKNIIMSHSQVVKKFLEHRHSSHCQDSVIYILKSGTLWSHRRRAMTEVQHLISKPLDTRACTVSWCSLYCRNLRWFPVFDCIKNMEYVDDRTCIETRVPKIIWTEEALQSYCKNERFFCLTLYIHTDRLNWNHYNSCIRGWDTFTVLKHEQISTNDAEN